MRTLLVTLCLLLSTPVYAETKWTYIVPIAGQSADWVTSYRFSVNDSGCTESNTRVRRPDGSFNGPKAAVYKAVSTGATLVLVYFTTKSQSRLIRWMGRGTAVFGGVVGGAAAVHNVRSCGF